MNAFTFDGREDDEDGPVLRPKHRGSGGGTSALIWGLVSFFLFPPLGFIAISVANSARRYNKSDGKATVGLVLGWIAVIETILGCCVGVPVVAWLVIAAKQQIPMVQ